MELESRTTAAHEDTCRAATGVRQAQERPSRTVRRAVGTGLGPTATLFIVQTPFQFVLMQRTSHRFLLLGVFLCTYGIALAFGEWLLRARVTLDSEGIKAHSGLKFRPIFIPWSRIIGVAFVANRRDLEILVAGGSPWLIPAFAQAAVIQEVALRCGQSVFRAPDIRLSTKPLGAQASQTAKITDGDGLGAYGILALYGVLAGCAGVLQWLQSGWLGLAVFLPLALLGLWKAYAYVKPDLDNHQTAVVTVDDRGIKATTRLAKKWIPWEDLLFARRATLQPHSSSGSLLLVGSADSIYLPAHSQLHDIVVDMILKHAPESAALYGL